MKKPARLFEPIKIGTMEIKNRIVMTPFPIKSTEDTAKTGVITERYIDFLEERARGGVGLIILPDTCIDRNLRFQSHPCIGGDEFNTGLSALTEAVHVWGAKIAPDLWLRGYYPGDDWHPAFPYGSDWQPLSTSPLSYTSWPSVDMKTSQIEGVEDLFAEAALRAKITGFDAIHLAGHFGFLIAQFLSPAFNRRTDKYGGKLENRVRFAVEIVQKIKDKIGASLPIIFRLSADEHVAGGVGIEEAKVISQRLEAAGVDALNITAGLCPPDRLTGRRYIIIPPMGSPPGVFVDLAAQIKEAVNIPVIGAGRVTEPWFAEKILEDGKADMVGMARQLAADPEWPLKAAEGRFTSIAPCTGCNTCLQRLAENKVSRCSVNAALGREREFRIVPALKPGRVMVVGGGPAGLEVARVAALRGHTVSLYEKTGALGGQLNLSEKSPHKDEIRKFREYLVHQAVEAGVDIKLNLEVTPATVKDIVPDVVVVATGALPLAPEIPGISGPNVVTAWEVLAGKTVGTEVVIAGGGMTSCETAEYLINQGKKVTIVEMLPEIAADVEPYTIRPTLLARLAGYDLNIHTDSLVVAINRQGLLINHAGEEKLVAADSVVIAMGSVPDSTLASQLRGNGYQLYTIGDCVKPGRIEDAINQAAYLGRQI